MTQPLTPPPDLAGRLLLRPAAPRPNIASTRPRHLPRLLRGRAVAEAVHLLPSFFSLCAGAHRLAARLATQAALGRMDAPNAPPGAIDRLQRETLSEHLRRLWLDLPLQLGAVATAPEEMKRVGLCLRGLQADPSASRDPVGMDTPPDAPPPELAAELSTGVFGPEANLPLRQALAQRDDGALDAWLARGDGSAARTIGPVRAPLRTLAKVCDAPLPEHPDADFLAHCDRQLDVDDDFESRPRLPPGTAETGPWTRHGLPAPRHALDRVLGRLTEVARLIEALPGAGRPAGVVLAAGSWSPAPGRGLGWAQMARGLLIHRATVSGTGAAARIDDYRVLAPTEWNFHPHGAAARALSVLSAGESLDADTARIAMAFDPCVRFERVESLPDEGDRDA